jgi:hypothetical protein
MLDPKAVTQLVEQQIARTVDEQVLEILSSDHWLEPIEQKVIKFSQDKIVAKFANSAAIPEIIQTVKASVKDLFDAGQLPGIDQFIDEELINQQIEKSVEQAIEKSVNNLFKNIAWAERIENLINQTVTRRTVTGLSQLDIKEVINQRVDENLDRIRDQIIKTLSYHGIQDTASQCELTVLDQHVVVENQFTAKSIDAIEVLNTKHLNITGDINIDSDSWTPITNSVTEKTLKKLNLEWRQQLIDSVRDSVAEQGIDFKNATIEGEKFVTGNQLTRNITSSNLQELGVLNSLVVSGPTSLSNTMNVLNRRVGINTDTPEMALSVWDEEVTVIAGKFKSQTAYVGTSRAQGLVLGVNRNSALEIDTDGTTTVKKFKIGFHQIGLSAELPGWSGTRGDMIFNSNPNDNVLGWQCLGGHKWRVIKTL